MPCGCDLTLLTATDLPWQADGLQRDGPQVREPVDRKVRAALERAGAAYAVVLGTGDARLTAALASVEQALAQSGADAVHASSVTNAPDTSDLTTGRWHWHCERCGDPDCERRARRPLLG